VIEVVKKTIPTISNIFIYWHSKCCSHTSINCWLCIKH